MAGCHPACREVGFGLPELGCKVRLINIISMNAMYTHTRTHISPAMEQKRSDPLYRCEAAGPRGCRVSGRAWSPLSPMTLSATPYLKSPSRPLIVAPIPGFLSAG